MIGRPPVITSKHGRDDTETIQILLDDLARLKDWCDRLYDWVTYPDKMEAQFIELQELAADVDAPAANRVRIYAKDNGSGKTQLLALFNTGLAQEIDVEPS